MTITENLSPPTLDERIARAKARWEHAQAETLAALTDLMALLCGNPAPSDEHVERFFTDIRVGDQVQWQDGWWNVDAVAPGHAALLNPGRILTLTRVGHVPLELPLAENVHLTTVRPS